MTDDLRNPEQPVSPVWWGEEWFAIDKRDWPDGPWQDEPDRVDWRDDDSGLPCLALRNENLGVWCGYVAVPEGHPWFDSDDDEIPAVVHGGVTFTDACRPDDRRGCPHAEDEPHRVWIGFDCGHAGDCLPGIGPERQAVGPDAYRALEYVLAEVSGLAGQADRATRALPERCPSCDRPL